jgi:hypothetical protein
MLTTALFTCAALAQTANKPAADSAAMMHCEGEWRASKLVGVNLYNEANEKIGDINDVILGKSGRVETSFWGSAASWEWASITSRSPMTS